MRCVSVVRACGMRVASDASALAVEGWRHTQGALFVGFETAFAGCLDLDISGLAVFLVDNNGHCSANFLPPPRVDARRMTEMTLMDTQKGS